jgi:hypothetical protein
MRHYADCKHCHFQHRISKCLPCTAGENFEPEEEEGLDFDKIAAVFLEASEDE